MSIVNAASRLAIAYIAVHYPDAPFTTADIPVEYRQGMSAVVKRGHADTIKRVEKSRTMQITKRGALYAKKYAQDEMQAVKL